jgi:hypothetical protein
MMHNINSTPHNRNCSVGIRLHTICDFSVTRLRAGTFPVPQRDGASRANRLCTSAMKRRRSAASIMSTLAVSVACTAQNGSFSFEKSLLRRLSKQSWGQVQRLLACDRRQPVMDSIRERTTTSSLRSLGGLLRRSINQYFFTLLAVLGPLHQHRARLRIRNAGAPSSNRACREQRCPPVCKRAAGALNGGSRRKRAKGGIRPSFNRVPNV